MGLAVQDHRIDREADIVDADPAQDCTSAGLGIDLDLADMRARGKAPTGRYRRRSRRACRATPRAGSCVCGRLRDVENADLRSVPLIVKTAVGEIDVASAVSSRCAAIFLPFSMIASEAVPMARLAIRIERRNASRRRPSRGRCRGRRNRRSSNGTPSHSVRSWAKAGLVALAAVHGAEHQLDPAFAAHRDLGALARGAAGRLRCSWRGRCRAACRAARFRAARRSPANRQATAPRPCPARIRRCHR